MDQELIAYLNRRFSDLDRRFAENEAATRRIVEESAQRLRQETREQIRELREETGAQFKQMREETGAQFKQMREETGAQFKQMREETGGQIQELREETRGLFRQTQVMVEDVRSDVRLVAEGVAALDQKVDRLQEENAKARGEDRAFFTALFRDVQGRMAEHGLA